MKYLNYYLLVVLLIIGNTSNAQVFLNEDFSGTTGSTPPSGWTQNIITGQSYDTWRFNNPGSRTLNSPISNPAAIFDSDNYSSGGGSENVALESPAFNTTGNTTIFLKFDQYFRDYFNNTVYVEVYNGTTWVSVYSVNSSTSDPNSQTINISTAAANRTGVKVRFRWTGSWSYYWILDNISVYAVNPCSGTPSAGNTVAAQNPICSTGSTTLSLQNTFTSTGISYQWQSSANGTTYSNVSSGGTASTYTASPTSSTYYRCIVTCSNSSASDTSTPLLLNTSFFACYCIPQIGGGGSFEGCLDDDMITNVSFGTLNNSSTCSGTSTTISYIDYGGSVTAPTLTIGSSYTLGVTSENEWDDHLAAWIDFNQNGTFESSEFVSLGTTSGSGTPQTLSTSWAIPTTATAGTTKMRVKNRYSTTQTSTSACTGYTYGECEDYNITLVCPTVSITTQPTNQTECSGDNATFTVAASTTGGFTVSRQWEVNTGSGWTNAGSTATTLTVNSVNSSMNGNQYRCVITSSCGNQEISNTATLTVNELPAITGQPSNSVICDGSNTNFSVGASGTNLTYQWEVNTGSGWGNVANGGVYSNATTATLNISGATVAMSGNMYRCTVSGTCTPAVTSNIVSLTVNSLPAVTTHPTNKIICPTTNTSFSCAGTGTNVTYQWQVNTGSGGWVNVTNTGVYSNATTTTLNITGAPLTMNNYKYRCTVSGTCTPSVNTNEATLTVTNENTINVHPANTLVCTGTPGSMDMSATGFNLTYQWQVNTGSGWVNATNGAQYSGVTTNTINFLTPTLSQNGDMFRCVTTNACGTNNTSNAATLSVITAPTITTQPTNKTICNGGNTSFTVMASSSGSIEYRWQHNTGNGWVTLDNTAIYSGVKTNTITITGANQYYNGRQFRCLINTGCTPSATSNAVTLTVNVAPQITQNPTGSLVCAGGSTTMSVMATGSGLTYQWQVNTGSSWTNATNGTNYSNTTSATLNIANILPSMNGYKYRCVVSGVCTPSQTSGDATLSVGTNTSIVSQPSSITTCSPGSGTFNVSAIGTNLTYKWYNRTVGTSTWVAVTNSSIFSGATTSSLSVSNINVTGGSYSYEYYCEVSGTCGTQNSSVATFTVNSKPQILTQPLSGDLCDNSQAEFSISAIGTGINYQWQENRGSGWSNLSNNTQYSNVNTNKLTIASVSPAMSGYQYRCVVSGVCSPNAVSSAATLNVNPIVTPSVSIVSTNVDICEGTSVTFNASGTNGGTLNKYDWTINGVPVATGSSYTTSSLAHNDIVRCNFTSNQACRTKNTDVSNAIIAKVTDNKVPTINITSSSGNVECSGVPITFKANITNGGATPDYNWQVNGQAMGTNIDSFVISTLKTGDVVKCVLTSSYRCPTPQIVSSNNITMTINKTTKSSIVIQPASDTVICAKQPVTILSYYTNGGATPKYQWMLNGQDIQGETNATLSISTLQDQDEVQCRFISSALCVFPEVSNPLTYRVNNPVTPGVDVAVSYNGGSSYTFTAIPTNGGNSPAYQWYVNGIAIPGETGVSFTTSDYGPYSRIYVEMTSSLSCVVGSVATSRKVTTSVKSVAGSFEEIGLYPNPNNGQFTIKGQLSNTVTNETVTLKITNALGQTVYNQVYPASGRTLDMPVSLGDNLANGLYTVNIIVDDQVTNLRFMLNR